MQFLEFLETLPVVGYPRGEFAADGAPKLGIALAFEQRVGGWDCVGECLELLYSASGIGRNAEVCGDFVTRFCTEIGQTPTEQPTQTIILVCHDAVLEGRGKCR